MTATGLVIIGHVAWLGGSLVCLWRQESAQGPALRVSRFNAARRPGTERRITSLPPYPSGGTYPSTGIPFSAGQVIKVHTEYQNGTPEPQTDVMGILMGWYVPQSGGYPRPKGATPSRVSLVPAFRQCTSPNRTHGAPLASQSCAPPVQSSSFLTIGSPDANGAPANSIAPSFSASATRRVTGVM